MAADIVLFKGEKLKLGYEKIIEARIRNLNQIKGRTPELTIVEANDSEEARKAAESRNIDIIIGVEKSDRKDKMSFRESGLNQVICALCREHNIAIAIPVSDIINSPKRNYALGRLMQNIRLCRKYGVRMVAASFARNKYEQRSPNDIESFLRTMGMTPKDATESLNNVKTIMLEKEQTLKKGVRIKA